MVYTYNLLRSILLKFKCFVAQQGCGCFPPVLTGCYLCMRAGKCSYGLGRKKVVPNLSVYAIINSRNSKELSVIPQTSDVAEDRFLMIDRAKIHALRTTLKEAELALEILKKVGWINSFRELIPKNNHWIRFWPVMLLQCRTMKFPFIK